jgi:SAM-dependent methyltransferase
MGERRRTVARDEGVAGYDYNEERDRRWRTIVDRFCLLETKNEADEVAPRLVDGGARRVLEVGSHWGPMAERLAARGVEVVCLELDREIVRLAHRPAVRGTAAALPFADGSFDAVTALNVLYFLERPAEAIAEARRVLGEGGRFVACTQMRDNDPELRDVAPGWGEPGTFDGEDAPAIVASVFGEVEVEPWDLAAYRLPTRADVVDYVEVFCKIPRREAERRSAGLAAPLTITKRGVFVWGRR